MPVIVQRNPLLIEFMKNINKEGQIHPVVGQCWEWTGARFVQGYGRCDTMKFGSCMAHRASWEMYRGIIPEGMCICHKCDNKLCVNPQHLFVGTQKDNMEDMIAKGRDHKASGDCHGLRLHPESVARGEDHHLAALTEEQVIEMRIVYQRQRISQSALGVLYGVAQVTVGRLLRRETWKHV